MCECDWVPPRQQTEDVNGRSCLLLTYPGEAHVAFEDLLVVDLHRKRIALAQKHGHAGASVLSFVGRGGGKNESDQSDSTCGEESKQHKPNFRQPTAINQPTNQPLKSIKSSTRLHVEEVPRAGLQSHGLDRERLHHLRPPSGLGPVAHLHPQRVVRQEDVHACCLSLVPVSSLSVCMM